MPFFFSLVCYVFVAVVVLLVLVRARRASPNAEGAAKEAATAVIQNFPPLVACRAPCCSALGTSAV